MPDSKQRHRAFMVLTRAGCEAEAATGGTTKRFAKREGQKRMPERLLVFIEAEKGSKTIEEQLGKWGNPMLSPKLKPSCAIPNLD